MKKAALIALISVAAVLVMVAGAAMLYKVLFLNRTMDGGDSLNHNFYPSATSTLKSVSYSRAGDMAQNRNFIFYLEITETEALLDAHFVTDGGEQVEISEMPVDIDAVQGLENALRKVYVTDIYPQEKGPNGEIVEVTDEGRTEIYLVWNDGTEGYLLSENEVNAFFQTLITTLN